MNSNSNHVHIQLNLNSKISLGKNEGKKNLLPDKNFLEKGFLI